MKDLVQCRKLEAKFRQLAVSDPARRFLWLAETEKWEREAEAEIASHFEARNAVRTTVAIEPITIKSSARSWGRRSHCELIPRGWEEQAVLALALQLPFPKISESMGNHDSKIVDAGSVD